MIDGIVELVLALVAVAGVIWGALGRRKAFQKGKVQTTDRIAREITEADYETRERIQQALDSHPGDRDAARERLRRRLEADR